VCVCVCVCVHFVENLLLLGFKKPSYSKSLCGSFTDVKSSIWTCDSHEQRSDPPPHTATFRERTLLGFGLGKTVVAAPTVERGRTQTAVSESDAVTFLRSATFVCH